MPFRQQSVFELILERGDFIGCTTPFILLRIQMQTAATKSTSQATRTDIHCGRYCYSCSPRRRGLAWLHLSSETLSPSSIWPQPWRSGRKRLSADHYGRKRPVYMGRICFLPITYRNWNSSKHTPPPFLLFPFHLPSTVQLPPPASLIKSLYSSSSSIKIFNGLLLSKVPHQIKPRERPSGGKILKMSLFGGGCVWSSWLHAGFL